ncbi:hypothetical protein DPMN_178595 [Dreissena polymorpha]|uniref:Uncharacterized protein n=1 Tax=Dreissena polymorpha TaxID=45954 RepID=A0A9D4ECH4_DREPO|nr:hypothetical protein DPMN_178595 [Dreissena polymorpha]
MLAESMQEEFEGSKNPMGEQEMFNRHVLSFSPFWEWGRLPLYLEKIHCFGIV